MTPSRSNRPASRRTRRASLAAAALALVGLGAPACSSTSQVVDEPSDKAAWRKDTVALSIKGYEFNGGGARMITWVGSGSWVARDKIVTNAHVALRAVEITGTDDFGRTYTFDRILAVDQANDLAIVGTARPTDIAIPKLTARPQDPKTLRGRGIMAIGNTGGLGLSLYEGRVVNVLTEAKGELLLHDAATSSGSSGGPLYSAANGNLMGVHHSYNPALRFSMATPAWIVQQRLEEANKRKGVPFTMAFDPKNMPVDYFVERATCLKPGEVFKGAFNTDGTRDLVAEVAPAVAGQKGLYEIHGGGQLMSQGAFNQKTLGLFSLKFNGTVVYLIGNPKDATQPLCLSARFGRIAWEKRIQ